MKNKPSTPILWPSSPIEVMAVANTWYDATHVAVDRKMIAALDLPPIQVGTEPTMAMGDLGLKLEEEIELSLALNSINYQFWDLGPGGEFIRYAFEGEVGALGMVSAFKRAWFDPYSPLSRAREGEPLGVAGIQKVFGDIPSPQSRADILNEVLPGAAIKALSQAIIDQAESGGVLDTALASRLAHAFPLAYGDPVLKKAQLAISEAWVKSRAAGLEVQSDLTAFADYQIPNILRALGVLCYSPSLAARIDGMQPLGCDSPEERAIRAASLVAVECIAQENGAPVAAVDHYLWMRRKEASTPFHLTFTTAY